MVLNISISTEAEAKLRERAEAAGQSVAEFAARLVEQAVNQTSLDAVLASFRKEVQASGLSDPELEQFYEGIRDDVWRERGAGS